MKQVDHVSSTIVLVKTKQLFRFRDYVSVMYSLGFLSSLYVEEGGVDTRIAPFIKRRHTIRLNTPSWFGFGIHMDRDV